MLPMSSRPFDLQFFLAHICEGRSIHKFHQNQIVFAQGEPADAVYCIQTGEVKVTVVSEHGKEAIIAVLGAGNFLGEACLTGQILRIVSATALADSQIVRLEKPEIMRAIRQHPAFAEFFIDYLLNRTFRVEADLIDQLFNSCEKRLARLLLLLANFGRQSEPQPILAKISQEMLAEMIGTNRSRVNFYMNKFRQLGFIDYSSNHIEVHSSLLNAVLLEQPNVKT